MKSNKEIKQKIEDLRNEYRKLNTKYNVEDNILITQLLSDLSSQVRILKWVLNKEDNKK